MSIRNGYADRQKEEIRVLYRQCPGEEDQSVQLAIALIHGKWKIGILSNLQRGPVRLSQLRRMFPQASKKNINVESAALAIFHRAFKHLYRVAESLILSSRTA